MGSYGKHWKVKNTSNMNKSKLGKSLSKEHKEKLSLSRKGIHYSPNTEFKKGQINPNTVKASKLRVGEKNSFYGKHHSEEMKQKLRLRNKNRTGKRAFNWQGGKTKLSDKLKNSEEYKIWRKSVFERDNYTCVLCGKQKSGKLNADHIKPRCKYPDLIFDVNNGRTLCVDCHKQTDTYGWRAICH